jgi:IK cytokine
MRTERTWVQGIWLSRQKIPYYFTQVEEKRKYLGGDGEHSILVKGLDMALLEQSKARVALEQTVDDDSLEQAYLEASSSTIVPKKRSRQDIIKELKQKRSRQGEPDSSAAPESQTQVSASEKGKSLEDVKKQGKFKPIGFKPIGAPEEGKKKKKAKNGESVKDGGERKKKKRKVENSEVEVSKTQVPTPTFITKKPSTISTNQSTMKAIEPEPEPLGEDFDIFAGAGDYEGLEVDDEEDKDETDQPTSQDPIQTGSSRKWIETEDDALSKPFPSPHEPNNSERIPSPSETRGQDEDGHDVQIEGGKAQENEDEEQQPMRLEALESSNLPSIRDFLAMDDAASAAEKRKKRKEKKKSGGGPKNMEAKVNRDFQR